MSFYRNPHEHASLTRMKEELVQQQKKKFYPLSDPLRKYLVDYKRQLNLPVHYENLLQSEDCYPVMNAKMRIPSGKLWSMTTMVGKHRGTKNLCSFLRPGSERIPPNSYVDRVDYCTFGNTKLSVSVSSINT